MNNENPVGNKDTDHDRTVSLRDYAVLERELTALKELIDIRSDNDTPGLEDIWLAGQPVGRIIESNRKKADSAAKEAREGASSGSEPEGQDGKNGDESGDDGGMLPIERLSRIDENPDLRDSIMADVTPSVERATVLFDHFREWSKKTPKGRTITENLRNLLNTATGERLAWRQIYRACEALEEWSKGAIAFEKTSRHGWILIQSSSAGRGG